MLDRTEYNISEIPKYLSTCSDIALKLMPVFNIRIKISHNITSAIYSPYGTYTADSLVKISIRNAVELITKNNLKRLSKHNHS